MNPTIIFFKTLNLLFPLDILYLFGPESGTLGAVATSGCSLARILLELYEGGAGCEGAEVTGNSEALGGGARVPVDSSPSLSVFTHRPLSGSQTI